MQNVTTGDSFVTFIQIVRVMSWPSLFRTTSLNECGANQIKMDEVHKTKTQIRGVKGRTELVISIPLRKHNLRMTTILFSGTWTWRNMKNKHTQHEKLNTKRCDLPSTQTNPLQPTSKPCPTKSSWNPNLKWPNLMPISMAGRLGQFSLKWPNLMTNVILPKSQMAKIELITFQ